MNSLIIHESAQFGEVSITKRDQNFIEFIAVLQEASAPNRNGRIYPKSVLEKALNSPNIQEKLATKTWFGECNHPMDTSVTRQMTIDLRNVAFIIKEFWWEGNLLKGRCETANTSVGRDMMGLIEQGCKVAFSLRAQGNVHTNPVTGLVEVEDGLQILGYDWVQTPSHAKAFMERICEETIKAMYRTSRQNLNSSILCESEDLFMQGKLLNIEPSTETVQMDYTRNYTDKFKQPEEMYRPENDDEVKSMDLKETYIVNSVTNVSKKVLTEDFIVKDIRGKLSTLFEAPIGVETGNYYNADSNTIVGKSKPNSYGNYTATYQTEKKREEVVGNVNRVKDAATAYMLSDDKKGRKELYDTTKTSLKEAPIGVDSGDYVKPDKVLKVDKTANGEYVGIRTQHGKRAEAVIGNDNETADLSMHKRLSNDPSGRLKKSIEISDTAKIENGKNNW